VRGSSEPVLIAYVCSAVHCWRWIHTDTQYDPVYTHSGPKRVINKVNEAE
jgi:hypothetical protein